MSQPKVTVFMITYNHSRYIAQAIESVLMQVVDFEYEIIIGDDASTDDTSEILRGYEARFSNIRLVIRERNLGAMANVVDLYRYCRGDYVAFLEGDDFWVNSAKLQRQVNALDSNGKWSMCFHPVECVSSSGESLQRVFPDHPPSDYGFQAVVKNNLVPTCSIMFRRACFPSYPDAFKRFSLGDWPLCMLLAERGELGFLPEVMAAYRVHSGGTWSSQGLIAREQKGLEMLLAMQDLVRPENVPIIRRRICDMFEMYGDFYERAMLYEEIKGIEHSWSWKITRPLRAVASLLGRWSK